jgi:23S rRNA (adenine2503-C2)-methyltransferase
MNDEAPLAASEVSQGSGDAPSGALRPELLGMKREELARALAPLVDRPFRAAQVYDALHRRGATGFAAMTDVPQGLRAELAQRFRIGVPEIASRHVSADGTAKYLFRLADGATVESVDIPDRDRRTLCLSSQAGCALACTFCVTGYWGAGRNLTAGEIVGQVAAVRADRGLPAPGLNLVFMGMGEPLMNVDAVLDACERLPAIGIAHSHTTVSTVGWIPGIEAMTDPATPHVRLALSLHAADPALRSELMPVNDRYPLADVMEAVLRWHGARRRKVYIEYVMLDGVNDRYEQAVQLAELLQPRNAFKVNLIPYNPTDGGFRGSSRAAIAAFKDALAERGVAATLRLTRGRDIDAACGQLAAKQAAA